MARIWVFVVILCLTAIGASAASASTSHGARLSQTPGSEPTTTTAQPVAQMPVEVAPAPSARPSTNGLPVTGSNIVGLTAVGVVLVAGGALVLTARRRRWS